MPGNQAHSEQIKVAEQARWAEQPAQGSSQSSGGISAAMQIQARATAD